jgi:hypothetical protein
MGEVERMEKMKSVTFIKVNNGNVCFEQGNVIRIHYVKDSDIMTVNGVVIDVFDNFVTVLYLTPDIKHSDKKLPVVKVENNMYRVTPLLFYVFKNFYRYIDVVTTLDKDMFDLIKFTTIEQPMDKLSYRLKRFYRKETSKHLILFYDIMFNTVIKDDG